MSEWIVLLHVAVAFWFVAGLLGSNVTMAKARSSAAVGTVVELVELSGRFERLMVIPGSFAVVVAGLLAAWAQGRPLAGTDDRWLLTSLILFIAIGVLVGDPGPGPTRRRDRGTGLGPSRAWDFCA